MFTDKANCKKIKRLVLGFCYRNFEILCKFRRIVYIFFLPFFLSSFLSLSFCRKILLNSTINLISFDRILFSECCSGCCLQSTSDSNRLNKVLKVLKVPIKSWQIDFWQRYYRRSLTDPRDSLCS